MRGTLIKGPEAERIGLVNHCKPKPKLETASTPQRIRVQFCGAVQGQRCVEALSTSASIAISSSKVRSDQSKVGSRCIGCFIRISIY